MKVVILAGGYGTRLSEETVRIPKPMVKIGDKPILWHIMKIYSYWGFNEFVICLGYKGYVIKEYFYNYFLHNSDLTIDLSNNTYTIHKTDTENWKVTLIDTGLDTMTGGRLLKVVDYLDDEFMMTYGDGVGDINIQELVKFHKQHGKLATVTVTNPTGRFGILKLNENNLVTEFKEKPEKSDEWVNSGFFVLNKRVLDYIDSYETSFEYEPMEKLVKDNQLMAYKHFGFWKAMDTLRDKKELENMIVRKEARWMLWEK